MRPPGAEAPTDVIPLPSTAATCAGCGAPLAADQRYCLSCGRPCSPVRLAFLDVLEAEHRPGGVGTPLGSVLPGGAPYPPPSEPDGMLGSLRRYSGLFGLLTVLLASLLIGLLVGHWLTGGASAGKQVYEVKGLAAPAVGTSSGSGSAGSGSAGSGSSGSGSSPGSGSAGGRKSSSGSPQSHASAKNARAEEAEEVKEIKTTTGALPSARKTSAATLRKLEHTTGKQHAKEVAALGNAPIESGGH